MNLRLDRQTSSAIEVAHWLAEQPQVARVNCPMLPGAPGHDLWARDFTGGCGLMSVVLKGGDTVGIHRLIDALELFGIGYSWGGFESLVVPFDAGRVRTASAFPPEAWGVENRLGVRLSIGLEDPEDLMADLEQALAAMDAA